MYINTTTLQYPITESEIRSAFPNTSFSIPFVPPADYAWVFPSPVPTYDAVTQYAKEKAPTFTVKGNWEQQWEVVKLYDTQSEEDAAVAADTAAKKLAVQNSIVAATQDRLDSFAKTQNYDGILSACTYATSPTAKFAIEGQTCVTLRDATWSKLYSILAEVEAGTRPMPSGYADIEAELPILSWR